MRGHVLNDETLDWRALAGSHRTVVFYMAVAHLPEIVTKLMAAGASPHHPAAIVERATLPSQRTLRGTLETIVSMSRAAAVSAPALLMIGEVNSLSVMETAAALQGAVPAAVA